MVLCKLDAKMWIFFQDFSTIAGVFGSKLYNCMFINSGKQGKKGEEKNVERWMYVCIHLLTL
jgi:hypothetical protein